MKKVLLSLLLNLPLLAGNLQLQEGFVAAHTQMLLDSRIDPLNTFLQADISMQGTDITSIRGKFYLQMDLFTSDNKMRDGHMYKAIKVDKYPLATYSLSKVTKIQEKDRYQIEGKMNFFGKTRAFTTEAEIILDKGILTLKSQSVIRMSDFDVQMPCILFICTRDEVDLFIKAVFVP